MKNALLLLVVFLITILNNSCAFSYGQRRCESPSIPVRPSIMNCISNAVGVGQCFNPITQKIEVKSMENFVCTSAKDHLDNEEWIKQILGTGVN